MVYDVSGKGFVSMKSRVRRHMRKHVKEHRAIQLTENTLWVKEKAKIDEEGRSWPSLSGWELGPISMFPRK